MILNSLQIILGVSLIVVILLQGKGGGLSKVFGGDSFRSKRGLEKGLLFVTVVLGILFLISSILIVVLA